MSRISPGSSGASQVSRARPAAEAKVDRSPPRSEARAPDSSAAHFRDEFVGGGSRSGSAKSPLAATKSPAVAQTKDVPGAHSPGKDQLVQAPGSSLPGEAAKEILDKVRDFLGRIFGGGEENGGGGSSNENGPVVQSPGKDQLVQGPSLPTAPGVI